MEPYNPLNQKDVCGHEVKRKGGTVIFTCISNEHKDTTKHYLVRRP